MLEIYIRAEFLADSLGDGILVLPLSVDAWNVLGKVTYGGTIVYRQYIHLILK